ncbi:hypothetical protein KXX14_009038, partial [Aspergillus fumigatus]
FSGVILLTSIFGAVVTTTRVQVTVMEEAPEAVLTECTPHLASPLSPFGSAFSINNTTHNTSKTRNQSS